MTGNRWGLGKLYDAYMGRWSRKVASEFLAWLAPPEHGEWLDVGCGTGALTQAILERASPRRVVGCDPAIGFVAYAGTIVSDARARFERGDAADLPFETASFDWVVSGLVLNFVPQAELAVAEMARACRPRGTVAAYVWDYAGEMQLLRSFWDAAQRLDPAAVEADEGRRFPLCHPDRLREMFTGAGLVSIEVRPIVVETRFRDFSDFWEPFLSGQAPAPVYATSLSVERRVALRESLRQSLPTRPDGSIPLSARAWAVRGRKS